MKESFYGPEETFGSLRIDVEVFNKEELSRNYGIAVDFLEFVGEQVTEPVTLVDAEAFENYFSPLLAKWVAAKLDVRFDTNGLLHQQAEAV